MSIYQSLKQTVTTAFDAVVDKTSTQAQKSRLVTVMKHEEKTANSLYLEMGKYLYNNLREQMPEDVQALCAQLDESKERMARAQQRYREVIQQEMINREINKVEVKDGLGKLKEPIVAKAKDTAAKVKDTATETAAKVKASAKDTAVKVEEFKEAAVEKAAEYKAKTRVKHEEAEAEADDNVLIFDENNADPISDTIEEVPAQTVIEYESEPEPEAEAQIPAVPTEPAAEPAPVQEAVPQEYDQEFQRTVPVDIINETEFEESEPVVKPIERSNPIARAMKLRRIMTKKAETDE